MKQNDIVKYYYPEAGEENMRFRVLEINEVTQRAHILLINDPAFSVPVVEVLPLDELQSAEHDALIPKDESEAIARILEALKVCHLECLNKEQFLKVWFAVAYAFTGLHPDEVPVEIGETKQSTDCPPELACYDVKSGWPVALVPIGLEAWRRADDKELGDDELYPVDASLCGTIAGS
jgi:hypothetical protein